jgi:hypothetical protein
LSAAMPRSNGIEEEDSCGFNTIVAQVERLFAISYAVLYLMRAS